MIAMKTLIQLCAIGIKRFSIKIKEIPSSKQPREKSTSLKYKEPSNTPIKK